MWSWDIFAKQLFHRDVLESAAATVGAALAAQLVGVTLALILGSASTSRRLWLRRAVSAYVRLFRGTPLVLQILAFYIVPSEFGVQLPVFTAGVLALAMNEAAYLSEVVRSGLMSVDRGQREASQVLGMSWRQSMVLVVLPQAARVMIPPIGNAFNSLIKTTALLGFISYHELLRQANLVMDTIYRPFEIFAVITIYYLAMTTGWSVLQSALERRFALVAPTRRGRSREVFRRLQTRFQ
jgi:polar amino acid transport system permease protein